MSVVVQTADFDVAAEYAQLRAQYPQAGAIVVFVGLVRDMVGDSLANTEELSASTAEDFRHLELEHYPQMTERLCTETVTKAIAKFGVEGVRIVHRVGTLTAAEQIVLVIVAGAHRAETFQAAEYVMDYLKTTATIWKKEVGKGGGHWLGVKERDARAVQRWEGES